MTEAEWKNEPDFASLVQFVDEQVSERKRRLLAVAFCRLVPKVVDYPGIVSALEIAERYADGAASAMELEVHRQECRVLAVQMNQAWNAEVQNAQLWLRSEMAWAASLAATVTPPVSIAAVSNRTVSMGMQTQAIYGIDSILNPVSRASLMDEQLREHRARICDVVGDPFGVTEFREAWRSSTVIAIASQMYESKNFSPMPILADALQDAGCDNEKMLNHCREPGTHIRGCWVLDRVLAKK